MPIVRTYAPLVAGASKMKYSTFITYNVIGGIVWGAGVTLLGFWLGQIQFIADNIDYIFIGIVLVSVVPIIVEVGKRYFGSRKAPKTSVEGVEPVEPVRTPNDPPLDDDHCGGSFGPLESDGPHWSGSSSSRSSSWSAH